MKYRYVAFPQICSEAGELRGEFWENHKQDYPKKPEGERRSNVGEMERYRHEKSAFQMMWLNFFVTRIAEVIQTALKVLGAQEQPDTLFLVVFSEGCFTDVEDPDRVHYDKDQDGENEIILNYKNPFYADSIRAFTELTQLCTLAVENVMLCPGTIWWKDQIGDDEVLFHTAPVFYQGTCCFMWEKQLITCMDGAGRDIGEVLVGAKLKKWSKCRMKYMGLNEEKIHTIEDLDEAVSEYLKKGNPPFLIGIAQSRNPGRSNWFSFLFQGQTYSLTLDICMDFAYEIGKVLCPQPVTFHIVEGDGASLQEAYYYKQGPLLFCDAQIGAFLLKNTPGVPSKIEPSQMQRIRDQRNKEWSFAVYQEAIL